MTPQRTIAIGDIHGCRLALDAVLDQLQPQPDDLLVTLGDYIDRGPDSRGVLDRVLRLQKECQLAPLLGNHELMMLATLKDEYNGQFWLRYGGAETMESYACELEDIPEAHLEFLHACRNFHETDSHIFVHANYYPDLPMDEQPDEAIFWRHLSQQIPGPHLSGKKVICGHTPQPEGKILDLGHVICIDTYCFGDGCLTAMDVHSRQTWRADKFGNAWEESPASRSDG